MMQFRHRAIPDVASLFAVAVMLALPVPPLCAQTPPTIPDQGICRLTDDGDIKQVLEETGMTYVAGVQGLNLYSCGFPAGVTYDDLLPIVMANPDVIYFEPNYVSATPEAQQVSQPFYDAHSTPFIPGQSPAEYHAQVTASRVDWYGAHHYATGLNTVVAVVDGGFDLDHPALVGRMANIGIDFLEGDKDVSEPPGGSSSGHGTFVAGLVALAAPGCEMIPYRTLDTNGLGSSFAVAQAIYDAIKEDVDVINMSLALPLQELTVSEAIDSAHVSGIVTVAAAGNAAVSDPQYPAALPVTLAVGTVDSADILSGFSNTGTWLDVTAPGESIYGPLVDTLFGHWSGTSFSTAFVSAEAALLREARPAAHIDSIRTGVLVSAVDIDSLNPGFEGQIGSGRIDPLAALVRWTAVSGDFNQDGAATVIDVVKLIDHVFRDGPPPGLLAWGDCDCDGELTVFDVVSLIDYVFRSGAEPCLFIVP